MTTLVLVFWGTSILFSKGAVPIYRMMLFFKPLVLIYRTMLFFKPLVLSIFTVNSSVSKKNWSKGVCPGLKSVGIKVVHSGLRNMKTAVWKCIPTSLNILLKNSEVIKKASTTSEIFVVLES